jgi:hypothetical protein
MRRRSVLLLFLGALVVVGVSGAGGYAAGKNGAPSNEDAARERAAARVEVLGDADTAAKRERRNAYRQGATAGELRGRQTGATAGKQSGEVEVSDRDVGPTPLPEPLIPADVYAPQVTGGQLTDQPSEIVLNNHDQLEEVSWSETGGDVAIGSGTLFRIVACEPSCAEDPGERVPATVKAWEPTFNPDSVRYYSKLTVEPSTGEKFTVSVSAF